MLRSIERGPRRASERLMRRLRPTINIAKAVRVEQWQKDLQQSERRDLLNRVRAPEPNVPERQPNDSFCPHGVRLARWHQPGQSPQFAPWNCCRECVCANCGKIPPGCLNCTVSRHPDIPAPRMVNA